MKKLLLIAALTFTSFNVHAGLLDTIQGMAKDTITPVKAYAVESSGWNIRVYEWVMQSDPRFTVVYTVGESGGGSSQIVKTSNH